MPRSQAAAPRLHGSSIWLASQLSYRSIQGLHRGHAGAWQPWFPGPRASVHTVSMPGGSIWKNFLHLPVRGGIRGVASPRHGPGNDVMHRSHQWLLACSLLLSKGAIAQDMLPEDVFQQDELLAPDRPEAWAMNYFAA